MKRNWVSVVTLVFAAAAFAAALIYWQAGRADAEGQTVGFVEADKILESYSPAASVNEELARLRSDSENALREKVQAKYGSADVSTLPKENQIEIQRMVDDAEKGFQADVDKIRGVKWDPILNAIRETVGRVAAKNGVTVVLQKDSVVYGGVDLTDKVIEELNKNTAAPSGGATPTETPKTKK